MDGRSNRSSSISLMSAETILCMICMEPKPYADIFWNETCSCDNSYCTDCISKHIVAKVQENISRVNCPSFNCQGVLAPILCQGIIPKPVFAQWGDALCKSIILSWQKVYCPFKDCSVVLINDGDKSLVHSECPYCKGLFCVNCMVPWHSGLECREFQALGKDERGYDDLMAIELANNNKWRRCPNCKFYVDKSEGCSHITCRCRFEFCYGCGVSWGSHHHDGCSD